MYQLRLLRNQDSASPINSSVSYTVSNSDSFVLKMDTPCFSLFYIICLLQWWVLILNMAKLVTANEVSTWQTYTSQNLSLRLL